MKMQFNKSNFLMKIGLLTAAVNQLDDKEYILEVKEFRRKRSLSANGYFWELVGKLAAQLNTDNDSIYLSLLERYGVFTHVIVKEKAVEQFKQEYRLIKDLGEVKVNGQSGIQLQCFFGSSTYDTKQMARLIDGVVSECKDLDIETMTPQELQILKEEWGK